MSELRGPLPMCLNNKTRIAWLLWRYKSQMGYNLYFSYFSLDWLFFLSELVCFLKLSTVVNCFPHIIDYYPILYHVGFDIFHQNLPSLVTELDKHASHEFMGQVPIFPEHRTHYWEGNCSKNVHPQRLPFRTWELICKQHKVTTHLDTDSYYLQRENLFLISLVEYFPIEMGFRQKLYCSSD